MKSLIFLLLFISLQSYAQDGVFSQYMLNPFRYNPAYAGVDGNNNFELINRLQWWRLNGGYKSFLLSYNTSLDSLNSGIGGSILYDNQTGTLYKFSAKISYNYKIIFGKKHSLRIGPTLAVRNDWLDTSKLLYDCNYLGGSCSESYKTTSVVNMSIGGGLWYSLKSFFVGFSVDHINKPIIQFLNTTTTSTRLFTVIYANIGYKFSLGEKLKISPSIRYLKQGPATSKEANVILFHRLFLLGFAYRHQDAIIGIVGFKFLKQFQLVSSFDLTTSSLIKTNKGNSIEFSLRFQPKQKQN